MAASTALWFIFCLGRVWGHHRAGFLAVSLESLGMNWMAVLFLIFICLLAVDLVTLFGLLLPRLCPGLRAGAVAAGLVLSAIATFQGLRPPVIMNHEVTLPDLPQNLDGTSLVALSDTHVGSQLKGGWLAARVEQVKALKPDLVVLLGDIVEGHDPPGEELTTLFTGISAPLGVWAVLGNHESHDWKSVAFYKKTGFTLLRNTWVEVAPQLVLAGVDDLFSRYGRARVQTPMQQALKDRPAGAAILLSHTPWGAETAAEQGVGLMLSAHTHGGQIWPFGYLVRRMFPLFEGRYDVHGMIAIVCRGTGTWGPRLRLWHPGEILYITLRAGSK
ncbi:MAG: metallophosphoesterase [Pseudomonadota bacterium]